MSTETAAPRRSARNAGKPAPAPAAAPAAATKRKSTADAGSEKKAKPAAAAPSAGQLKVGDKMPSFKLKLQDGSEFDTGTLKNAVLFS